MAYNGLDMTTECYEIFVDNKNVEDLITEDEQSRSSAGHFSVTLQPFLDLSSLLYLRSVQAEIAIEKFEIGSLPLTFSMREACQVVLEIPLNYSDSNQLMNRGFLSSENKESLILPLADSICTTPKEVIDFVSDTFRHRVNFFIIARNLNLFFDDTVLDVQNRRGLSLQDIKLLHRYIDVGLYTRKVLHDFLCKLIGETSDDISSKIVFSNTNNTMKEATESRIIEMSQPINDYDSRTESRYEKTINFKLFHGVDVSKPNDAVNRIKTSIEGEIASWLERLGFDLTHDLTERDIEDIKTCINSNKMLVNLGTKSRSLLQIEMEKIEARTISDASIFYREVISFALDQSKQKCKFSVQPKKFLAENCKLTIFMPEKMSYALGAGVKDRVIIGPLTWSSDASATPRLTHQIQRNDQQLPFAVRTMPSLIHICTDIVTAQSRDSWLERSDYNEYHIIFSYVFDELAINSRSIVNANCGNVYYKLKDTNRLLETMKFSVLDQNFQRIDFATKTYTRLGFRIRPSLNS